MSRLRVEGNLSARFSSDTLLGKMTHAYPAGDMRTEAEFITQFFGGISQHYILIR